ncbi:MAG: S49 family peptidase, partial [Pyrinomonadaceae bacterium]
PDERARMEGQISSVYYDSFIPKVATGRKKTVEDANTLGQGRVWTGTQAKANGLIDEFGGLEKAIDIAKELANLPADKDVRRVVFPAPRPFLEEYFGSEETQVSADQKAQAAIIEAMPADIRRAFRYVGLFDRINQGDAMMMMPFELRIR